jgi:hypothetical protein
MRMPGWRKAAWSAPLFALALASLSCGGAGSNPPPPPGTSSGTGYFFIADAPPAGTSVLKFEITLLTATLCQAVGSAGECQGASQVPLIDAPLNLDLNNLQLGSAFLSSKSVPVGTYAGVRLTFSDYDLKVMLPSGTLKELTDSKVPLVASSVTPTFSSGLTVATNVNFAFLLDFDANNSIQSSATDVTGVSPVVSLVPLTIAAGQPVIDMPGRRGTVSSLSKTCSTTARQGSFTLTDALTGAVITNIGFDSTTLIGEPTDADTEKDITCDTLANGQIVEVDLEVGANAQNSPQAFAHQIQLVGAATGQRLEGTVFQVNTASEFVLFVDSRENLSTVPTGSFVTVSFDPLTAVFRLDAGDLPAVSTDFDSGDDLLAGQRVKVDVASTGLFVAPTGCKTLADLCTATANGLRLKQSVLSGRVAGAVDPDFTLDALPGLLGTSSFLRPLSADCQLCRVDSVQVTTSAATVFGSGLANVSSLAVNDIVEVRGLLTKNSFTGPGPVSGFPPVFLASQVRLRR